jgi:hypothetical protein
MMQEIARRDVENGYESLRSESPDKPGVIIRSDGSSYHTTVSAAAVLRGYGWRRVPTSDEVVASLWNSK